MTGEITYNAMRCDCLCGALLMEIICSFITSLCKCAYHSLYVELGNILMAVYTNVSSVFMDSGGFNKKKQLCALVMVAYELLLGFRLIFPI